MIVCRTPHLVFTQSILSSFIYRFPFPICVFTVKQRSVTQRWVSQENDFKKSKNPSPFFPLFFRKVIVSNNSFTLIKNNFRFLR